jgi:hypothetical protein
MDQVIEHSTRPCTDLASGKQVEAVFNFTYLGTSINSSCLSDHEISRILCMARAAMQDFDLIWSGSEAYDVSVTLAPITPSSPRMPRLYLGGSVWKIDVIDQW